MKPRILVALLGAIALALAVLLVLSRLEIRRLGQRDQRYRTLCSLVRVSIVRDASDLRDPKLKDEAIRRFLEPIAHHSYEDINQCVAEPLDLDRSKCAAGPDYASCLARLAETAAEAVARNLE